VVADVVLVPLGRDEIPLVVGPDVEAGDDALRWAVFGLWRARDRYAWDKRGHRGMTVFRCTQPGSEEA